MTLYWRSNISGRPNACRIDSRYLFGPEIVISTGAIAAALANYLTTSQSTAKRLSERLGVITLSSGQ